MAGDGEEEVVIPRWQQRKFVFEHLRYLDGIWILLVDLSLNGFWKDLSGQFSKPRLEQGADDVDIVEIVLFEKINVAFYCNISIDISGPSLGSSMYLDRIVFAISESRDRCQAHGKDLPLHIRES